MHYFTSKLQSERGQGLMEYTLIVSLVALVFWGGMRTTNIGDELAGSWSKVIECPAICYEHILRAIGQGLDSLSLEAFDLEVAGDTFSIRGIPTRQESEKLPVTKLKAFKKTFLDICNTSKTPRRTATPTVKVPGPSRLLRLDFTQADIDKLEREGQALRSDWERSPLSHSLPQILRTVGWYVDHKKGQIHKISRSGDTLTVSYTGLLGTQKLETLTLVEIYDMWVHLYKQRKGHFQIG